MGVFGTANGLIIRQTATGGQLLALSAGNLMASINYDGTFTAGGGGFTVSATGAVVSNENSNDVDLRVEGNADANLLYVDAGTDRVGIGTAAPAQKFHVALGAAQFDYGVVINEGSYDSDTRIEGDADANLFYVDAGNDRVGIGTPTPEKKFAVNGEGRFDYGLTVNEGGYDSDTRIEGDADANLLYIDASTDRVGIGTAAPAQKFHVALGAAQFDYGVVINEGSYDSDTRIEGNTDVNLLYVDAGADTVGIGMSAPYSKLSVEGDILYTGNLRPYRNATAYTGYAFVPLTAPLTSTTWDGDAKSDKAKTLIDLSAVFGAPAGIKAVLLYCSVRDSGSAANYTWMVFGADNTAGVGSLTAEPQPVNDRWGSVNGIVPCDANGDIYYQIEASGASTFDVYLEIYGYFI